MKVIVSEEKKASENNLSTKWEVSKQEMVFIGSFRHAWHQKTMTFDFMPIYCFRYLLPLPTSFYAQVILLLVSLSSTNQCAGAKLDFQWSEWTRILIATLTSISSEARIWFFYKIQWLTWLTWLRLWVLSQFARIQSTWFKIRKIKHQEQSTFFFLFTYIWII